MLTFYSNTSHTPHQAVGSDEPMAKNLSSANADASARVTGGIGRWPITDASALTYGLIKAAPAGAAF
uniref:Uncharacterized protein n=1 Tax=Romanomermis culicivorax TaxID=13658 RepID=A0A915IHH7_ROMCU